MGPRRLHTRSSFASVLILTLAATAAAAPASPADTPGTGWGAPGLAIEFAMLQPSQSPAVLGLVMVQRALQMPAAPSPDLPHSAVAGPVPQRTRALPPLIASYVMLQALDVHSTLRAVHAGSLEQNPIMAPLVRKPATFIAVKAAMTAGTAIAVHRLAKRNRLAAFGLMCAVNSAYAFIVVRNYRAAPHPR